MKIFSVSSLRMADVADTELLDYEEEEQTAGGDAAAAGDAATANGTNGAGAKDVKKDAVKGTYVSIHSSGFRDFLLKPEILRAIVDCGFEHPSEGECRNVFSMFMMCTRMGFGPKCGSVANIYVGKPHSVTSLTSVVRSNFYACQSKLGLSIPNCGPPSMALLIITAKTFICVLRRIMYIVQPLASHGQTQV